MQITVTQDWARGYMDAYNAKPRRRGQSPDYYAGYDAVRSLCIQGEQLVKLRRLALGIGAGR